jgi:hypothetical protein
MPHHGIAVWKTKVDATPIASNKAAKSATAVEKRNFLRIPK